MVKFKAACVQVNSINDMHKNLNTAISLIKEAAEQGADFITTPENVAFMSETAEELYANAYTENEHPALKEFQNTANKLGKFILVGSLAIKTKEAETRLANRSFVINNKGQVIARYDKIHLFDTSVAGGETHKESEKILPGNKAVTVETPWGMLGMTICYDVRFPNLYNYLANKGADFITVPSAFTKYTGEAHWHTLLRARAIETGCYIIAPAQTGSHPAGRKTFGHSLIIDPWGRVLKDKEEGEGVIIADLDKKEVAKTREQMPSLKNAREFV